MPPSLKDPSCLYTTTLTSPLGMLVVGATDQGICLVDFQENSKVQQHLAHLKTNFDRSEGNAHHPLLENLKKQLQDYFQGTRRTFDVPLHFLGTPFRRAVWQSLQQIPYGTTWSYAQQAISLNKPTAVRAVARANGNNPLSIIIPCHRVVGSNGSLTGYAGGLERKQWLLDFERDQSGF